MVTGLERRTLDASPDNFSGRTRGKWTARSGASTDPNDFGSGKETCVAVGATTGKLYDVECKESGYVFICELPSVNLPCL